MITSQDTDLFYIENLKRHGSSSQGVGWKDDSAQIVRFDQLVKVIDLTIPFSLNDLGCGVGDLSRFLIKNHFPVSRYHGYDILREMVDEAMVIGGKNDNIKFFVITDSNEISQADYTVSSGIFNPRHGISDTQWKHHIIETIQIMNDRSVKGFAFNALSIYSDVEFRKPELYYSDPLWLFDFCKINFSKNVALLHDYNQYDFTILVRK